MGEANDNGSQVGISACVVLSRGYDLDHPTVTTQRQLGQVIADANEYVAKLKQVRQRYEQAGLAGQSYIDKDYDQHKIRKLWP